uniref:Uncharacterized protein n=1 Tax=Cannabis sativa TaxID=3483 RepID=A0A803Q627_CANSA
MVMNAELSTRVERLKELVGSPNEDDDVSLFVLGEQHFEQLESLEALARDFLKESSDQVAGYGRAMMDMQREFDEKMKGVLDKLSNLSNFVKERFMTLDANVAVIKRAIANLSQGIESSLAHSSKIKVPKPKAFNGSKNSKGLEDFLWGRAVLQGSKNSIRR